MTDTANRVKKIVAEHLGVEESKVTDTASFIDDLGADSLDTVELVMAFEEEFGCEIPDEAAEKNSDCKRRYRLSFQERISRTGFCTIDETRLTKRVFSYNRVLNCAAVFYCAQ